MTKKEREQKEAVDTLKQWGLVDGSTVYAKVNKVSASGMSRNIGLYVLIDGRIVDISYHAAKALGWGYKDRYDGGVRVSGCGMDMLFHTVDSLSHAMGYGSINQENHDMHRKYNERREGCAECELDEWNSHGHAFGTVAPVIRIGLKYRTI